MLARVLYEFKPFSLEIVLTMTKRHLLVSVTAVRLWINIMIYRNIPLSDPYAFQNVELFLYLCLSSESSLDEYHWTINVHLVV